MHKIPSLSPMKTERMFGVSLAKTTHKQDSPKKTKLAHNLYLKKVMKIKNKQTKDTIWRKKLLAKNLPALCTR